jgi:hypothetical protein
MVDAMRFTSVELGELESEQVVVLDPQGPAAGLLGVAGLERRDVAA